MRKFMILVMAAMLVSSAFGCGSCRSWFNKGSSCDPPECGPYSGAGGVQGAPIYVNPGPG